MNLQVSITRGGAILSTETLENPQQGDVLKSIGEQLDKLKKAAGGKPLEPYQIDVREIDGSSTW